MNKVIAKIKAIDQYGEKTTFLHTYETDELFTDKIVECAALSTTVTISAKEQADKYFEGIDKSQLMIDKDLMCIIGWDIAYFTGMIKQKKTAKKKKKDEATLILERLHELGTSEKFIVEIAAGYSRMKESFVGTKLTIDQKVKILLAACGVGFIAAATAYQHMSDTLSGREKVNDKLLN